MQLAALKTTYRDAGKPDQAVPVTNECALPGAFTAGEVTTSPVPTAADDCWRNQADGFFE